MCQNPMKPTAHKIIRILKETPTVWSFRVQWDTPPHFGQFFMVSLPRRGEAPVTTSAIGDNWVELTIRNVGKVTDAIHQLRVGDNLFMRGPYGNGFPMEEFEGRHLVIAAGGSGVSPVRPLIEHYHNHPDQIAQLDLLLGFRDPDAILFKEDIRRWKTTSNMTLTVDQAPKEWDGNVGLITQYIDSIPLSDVDKMDVIIVGPPVMMKFTAQGFLNRNIPPERLVVSMERRMSCGIGKCGHCKVSDCYVCLDGPVFRYHEAAKLID